MATYIISDIHGQLDLLKQLLEKVNFHYDFSDELYILGDYCDWGEKPIDTLLYVMDLVEKYPFIHCTIGNHDTWLRDCIINKWKMHNVVWSGWGQNRGDLTYKDLSSRDNETKQRILDFLMDLPLEYSDITVSNRLFHLAHAAPMNMNKGKNKEDTATWSRLDWNERPNGLSNEYTMFIHGHTITSSYLNRCESLKTEVVTSAESLVMDIDCGAKAAIISSGYRLAIVDISNMKVYYSDENNPTPIWLSDDTYNKLNMQFI